MNIAEDIRASSSPAADAQPIACADLDNWAVFLDVDGTLLDIAPEPDAVVVPPGLAELLDRLHKQLGGALALVTGREIQVIDRLFAPLRFAVAGVHGAELRLPDGTAKAAAVHPDLPRIIAELQDFAATNEGLLVEPKGRAVAIHYRKNPALGEDVESLVRELVEGGAPGLEIQPGKMVFEVRPAKVDKGRAVAILLEHEPYLGRRPVVLGDDWTDEPAFRTANARDGRSIRVGRDKRPTEANETLADPAAVRAWLAVMLQR